MKRTRRNQEESRSSEVWKRPDLVAQIELEQKRLGERFRELRTLCKLTQEQAAEKAGLHVTHLSRIEGGLVNISFGTLVSLARSYEVSLRELFPESAVTSAEESALKR